ncbi:MAG: hypothetical protein JWN44_5279 [Myxococcales bacterium]|nr:hypothetical protein [Myxococcales bacterium]
MRAALLLTVILVGGCTRAPSAYITQRRLDGPKPPQIMLRCRTTGLEAPVKFAWRFAAPVKQVGWNVPVDETAILVTVPEPPQLPLWAECTATGAGNVEARASRALVAPVVAAAPVAARSGELVSVRGSGFGPSRNADDGVWLVPGWGRARPLDHACKGASWSDALVSACVPPSSGGKWQVRVQAGGELAIWPTPMAVP